MTRWFEDVDLNVEYPLGTHVFTADAIADFRAQYDPFSTGDAASGWHLAVVGHRLMVDTLQAESARIRAEGREPGISGPSPGINRLDLPLAVHAGEAISYTLSVSAKRPSNSLPGWGLLINHLTGRNAAGEIVYEAEVAAFIRQRDFTPTPRQRIALMLTRLPVVGKWLASRR